MLKRRSEWSPASVSFDTEQFVYGAVFVRRTGAVVAEPPLRLRMRRAATAGDFERICAWRQHRRRPQFPDWLAAARPRLCPQLESNVRSVVRNGVIVPVSAILSATAPLARHGAARCLDRTAVGAGWRARKTVAQTFEAAQRVGQGRPTLLSRFRGFDRQDDRARVTRPRSADVVRATARQHSAGFSAQSKSEPEPDRGSTMLRRLTYRSGCRHDRRATGYKTGLGE